MGMIWCGGEDIDFMQNSNLPTLEGGGFGGHRAGYARTSLIASGGYGKSNQFALQTSCWYAVRLFSSNNMADNGAGSLQLCVGWGQFAGSGALGVGWPTSGQVTLYKYDGVTQTTLAYETGNTMVGQTTARFDLQLIGYGSSATVNVYLNGSPTPLFSFTGDVTIAGMSGVDCIFLAPILRPGNAFYTPYTSEHMATSDDSRAYLGLVTLPLAGNGTTNDWTNNTYTNIDGIAYSDANPTYDNNNGDDQQYTLGSLPLGTWGIAAVKIAARCAIGAGSSVNHVELGYNSGGTVGFGSGATKAPPGFYDCFDQVDLLNPVTGLPWTQAQIAALQLDMRALT